MLISAVNNGFILSAFPSLTELQTMIDGHQVFEDYLALKVVPTLHLVAQPDSTVFTSMVNNSHAPKTLSNGAYIANGNNSFLGYSSFSPDMANFISLALTQTITQLTDPILFLVSGMTHSTAEQFQPAKSLSTQFQDAFSVAELMFLSLI